LIVRFGIRYPAHDMSDPGIGAPAFHPDWKRRLDRALAERVLCIDCMCTQIDVPKRYLADYLAWMRRNVVITLNRACEVCGTRGDIYGLPKDPTR
jgi:hypothetical protein